MADGMDPPDLAKFYHSIGNHQLSSEDAPLRGNAAVLYALAMIQWPATYE
jgi:hypothetical protein